MIPWIAPTCCPLTFCPEAGILIEKRLISAAHHGMPLNMQKGMCMQPPLPSRHEKLGTSTCQKSFKLFGPIVAYPQKPTARCSDGFPQVRSTALPEGCHAFHQEPFEPILFTDSFNACQMTFSMSAREVENPRKSLQAAFCKGRLIRFKLFFEV